MADIGLGQLRVDGTVELPLVTFGSDLAGAKELSKIHQDGWSAIQVMDFLHKTN
jgi:hypothetical protein